MNPKPNETSGVKHVHAPQQAHLWNHLGSEYPHGIQNKIFYSHFLQVPLIHQQKAIVLAKGEEITGRGHRHSLSTSKLEMASLSRLRSIISCWNHGAHSLRLMHCLMHYLCLMHWDNCNHSQTMFNCNSHRQLQSLSEASGWAQFSSTWVQRTHTDPNLQIKNWWIITVYNHV